jgi:exopolysaccharide biosynthesis polyprenyl glycosylphosphotransferase
MKIRNDYRLSMILATGDVVIINLSLILSYYTRFSSGLFPVVYGIPGVFNYYKLLPVLTVLLLFLMRSEKLYSIKSRLSIVDEFFTIVKVASLGVLVFMAGTFLYREFSYSRGMLLILWVNLIAFLGMWRFTVNRVRFYIRKKNGKDRNLLIIGEGQIIERLICHIAEDPHWDYRIRGILEISGQGQKKIRNIPVAGKISDLSRVLDEYAIEAVILTEIDMPRAIVMNVILECEKRMVEFRLVADLLGMVTSQVDMRTIDGIPLLGLKESPLAEGYNRFIKRFADITFSALGLIILSPLLLLIAGLVKISSPGPVFYLQKRIGEDGGRFTIFKFRTMVDKAEKGIGRIWAVEADPRRTKIGAFLRSKNLDELPQLINVFKGEMSLVGPRPERPHFVGKFKENIPRYMARHKIKSGLTGWAQVNGLRGNTSIEERTKYDLYYIENWSLALDFKIMFMSLFALKNAY